MKPVPQGAAHILVHYLYTERYEGLKVIRSRELDKTKSQFRMAVHVCDLAREYNLYQLEDLATDELVALTPMLQLGTMITILDQEEFTHTKISGWLRDYISHEVMTAGKATTPSVVRGMSDVMKHNRPITGIVCKAMARMEMENQRLRRALKENPHPTISARPHPLAHGKMKTEATDNDGPGDVSHTPSKKGATPSKSHLFRPYMGATYKLEFANKLVIKVSRGVIDKHSAFAAHFTDRRIDLTEMNESQAHILIHYLYTGSYQPLDLEAETPEEKHIKAFAVSLWVYAAAVEYDLEHLSVLATLELTKLGEGMTFIDILGIIRQEEFELGEHETWLYGYLAKRAQRLEPVSHDHAQSLRESIGEKRTLIDILVETIVNLKLEVQLLKNLLQNARTRG
ncbi:Hypothetical protein NCS54_00427600 [Fusarium falciforme]|uniref:Hypothetical protein n=1 Tax=Fusarium falciforme TaxID=195108 RepID=UPI0022FFD907|nr:Hypothetical protein NCS54_00427600 [Fusarium falciforme]WAO86982.1 Hypothetical protein NCS54_00427600 [Fusarium falciforme]